MSITPIRVGAGIMEPLGLDQWQNKYYPNPNDATSFPLMLDGVNGTSVNVGGTQRRLVGVFTKVSGNWRRVPDAWSRVSGVYRPLFGAESVVAVSFSALSVSEFTAGSGAKAEVEFRPNGEIWGDENGVSPYYIADWASPKFANVGARYWIRATATAGGFDNGLQTWQRLNVARLWNCLGSTSVSSCTFTIEIARDSSGSNITFTRTGNTLEADDTL